MNDKIPPPQSEQTLSDAPSHCMPFHVSKEELVQVDRRCLASLSVSERDELTLRLARDLRHAHDLLGRSSGNSSMPPSSVAVWKRRDRADAGVDDDSDGEVTGDATADDGLPSTEDTPVQSGPDRVGLAAVAATLPNQGRRKGRQIGAPGHGRTQVLPVDHTVDHRPECCAACRLALPALGATQIIGAWDSLEWIPLAQTEHGSLAAGTGRLGVHLEVTRHRLLQQLCDCGHVTRACAHVAQDDPLWPKVALGEHRLLGPRLAAVVVYLCLRMRCSRRKVQEVMLDLFALELSVGLIDQTVREAGRSAEPLEDAIIADLEQSVLVHADETPWPEFGQTLWLWVVCSLHTVLYVIGPRTAEMFDNVLNNKSFLGELMSDGYAVYRAMLRRLRCWAHLARKTRGLVESLDAETARAGCEMSERFKELMQAIYDARKHKAQRPPSQTHGHIVDAFKLLCERYRDAAQERVRALAREFLNDWETIIRPLAEPRLPLTNNHGERQLRHHVISRRISYGTRCLTGSRAYGLLASVFDTCRLRGTNGIETLAQTIDAARKGLPVPALPPIPERLRGWDAVTA
jgi:transposase